MAPRKEKSKKQDPDPDDSDEYRKRRDKNNMAVKKSRDKSKRKTKDTLDRVNELKNENTILEEKVKTLTKELGFLKQLFLAHASNSADMDKFKNIDLEKLLSDDTNEDS